MNKEELKQIVDRVHANWNIQPLPAQLQTIYRAWYELIQGFDYELIDGIITELAKEDSWAPRPGTVYRRAKQSTSTNPPPSVARAWEEYRRLAGLLDSGVWEKGELHPTLQKCITVIGGFHLHTNSDREHFTQIYTELVNEEYR